MKTPERSKNHPTERRSVRTAVATISYFEDGPSDGSPLFLLHGFPDDPKGFDNVVDRINNHGLRLIRPFLRGFGPTEVNEPSARSWRGGCSWPGSDRSGRCTWNQRF